MNSKQRRKQRRLIERNYHQIGLILRRYEKEVGLQPITWQKACQHGTEKRHC